MKLKLSIKANHKTSEELLLLKTIKYFDLVASGNIEIQDFKKALDKLGVSGFSEENISAIFNAYADKSTKLLDYKTFVKNLYANTTIKDKFEDVEYIVKRLMKDIQKSGFIEFVSLIKEMQTKAFESSIGLIPNEFDNINKVHRLNLKPQEIEKIFFAFYEINSFNHREFLLSLIKETSESRRAFMADCYNTLAKSKDLTVQDLIDAYKGDLCPGVRDLEGAELEKEASKLNNEFMEAVRTVLGLYASKRGDIKVAVNYDSTVDEQGFINFFSIVSNFFPEDENFYGMLESVFQIHERKKRQKKKAEEQSEESSKKKNNSIKEELLFRPPNTDDAPALNSQQLKTLENLRTKLLKLDKRFFILLNQQFYLLDNNKGKTLDFENFSKAVKLTNVSFFRNEISHVFGLFENKQKGTINYEYFLRTMINMNFRINQISAVFKKLESESITKNVISSYFVLSKINMKVHPEVLNGNLDVEEANEEFTENLYANFGIKNRKAGNFLIYFIFIYIYITSFYTYFYFFIHIDFDITKNDFINFYLCFSAGLQNDQLFEATLNNIWGLTNELYEFHESKYGEGDKNQKQTLTQKFEERFHGDAEGTLTPYGSDKKSDPYQDSLSIKKRKKKSPELIKFTEALSKRGTRGIMSLRRSFDVADVNGNGVIDMSEFTELLKSLRITLNKQEITNLFNEFDANGNGEIEYSEFVEALMGEIPEERVTRLKQVFFILDKNNSGKISIEEIKDGYKYKTHPDVLKGKKNPEEILAEFLDNVDYHFKLLKNNADENEMKFNDFIDFYKNISFAYTDTDSFNDNLKAVWGLEK